MNVFGYCRVSTSHQVDDGYSLDEQKDRIEAYCKALGWNLLKVYIDAAESGAKADRPALNEMVRNIKKVDKVVVYKLDRLSRSQKDTLYLIEDVFLANGVDFVSMTENFDTGTPFGRAIVGILAVFAQLEREQIKERMFLGRDARIKSGKHSGVSPALGYDYINGYLVPNEDRIVVEEIFDLASCGWSHNKIADEMNSRGYTLHGRPFHRIGVGRIIKNRVYLGETNWNKTQFKGLHEPLVSAEVFNAAHAILEERNAKFNSNNGAAQSLFGGIIVCAQCGEKFYRRTESHSYPRYVCHNRTNGDCKNKRWLVSEFDELILNEVRSLTLEQPKPQKQKPRNYDHEIAKLDAQLSRLIDLYSLGTLPLDALKEKTEKINASKMALLEEQQRPPRDVAPLLWSFDDVLANGSLDEIRTILHALIDHIEVDNDDIKIFWTFK